MYKFETVETLMYKYLIDELEKDLELQEQRIEILEKQEDYINAKLEVKDYIYKEEKLNNLKKYLNVSIKKTCNKPSIIEISQLKINEEKIRECEIKSDLTDKQEYFKNKTDFKIKDWLKLEENVNYKVGILLIRRVGNELQSRYPYESMWHVETKNGEICTGLLTFYGHCYLHLVE